MIYAFFHVFRGQSFSRLTYIVRATAQRYSGLGLFRCGLAASLLPLYAGLSPNFFSPTLLSPPVLVAEKTVFLPADLSALFGASPSRLMRNCCPATHTVFRC